MEGWTRASPEIHCPICEHDHNCEWKQATNGDGFWVYCGRTPEGSSKQNSGGQFLHFIDRFDNIGVRDSGIAWIRRDSAGDVESAFQPLPLKEYLPANSIHVRVKKEAAGAGPQIDELASILGVSAESLRRLQVGYSSGRDRGRGAWSFPEKDATGQFIGINYRSRSGAKRRLKNARSGLTYAEEWNTAGTLPILIVEGGSDTAAGLTMGLCVIGRPSNAAGAELLSELLKDERDAGEIVVLGENDLRPHKDLKPKVQKRHSPYCLGCQICWPGKYGALSVAQQLVERLHRQIRCALPPAGVKDLRHWLNTHPDEADSGAAFVARLQFLQWPVPQIEIVGRDCRPVIPLDEWRQTILETKLKSLGTPGVWFDGSPTGAGKTHSDVAAARTTAASGGRSLIVVPTHRNGEEIVMQLRAEGVAAEKYPKRLTSTPDGQGDPVNCWNVEADTAESFGLPAIQTVCSRCDESAHCMESGYLRRVSVTGEATVVVATHTRGSHMSLGKLADGRGFVSIHENPFDLLKPISVATLQELQAAADILKEISSPSGVTPHPDRRTVSDPDEGTVEHKKARSEDVVGTLARLAELAAWLTARLTTESCGRIELPAGFAIPAAIPAAIYQQILKKLKLRFGQESEPATGSAWRCLAALAEAEFLHADVMVTPPHKAGDEEQRCLVVVRNNPLPVNTTTIWLSDATLSHQDAIGLTGCSVTDATPGGRLPNVQRAVQIPVDFTQKTSAKTACSMLRGFLENHRDLHRIGIIGQRRHIEAMRQFDHSRIVMSTYFGSGDEGHGNCDVVVIFGTPRVPVSAVQETLIRLGRPARAEDAMWGDWCWSGQTISRKQRTVHGLGYRDESWRNAHKSIVRANLLQAVGRARAILDCGIPVYVFSTEECGLLLTDETDDILPITDDDVALIDVVSRLAATSPGGRTTTAIIASTTGQPERTVSRRLKELESRNLIGGGGAVGLWTARQMAKAANDTK